MTKVIFTKNAGRFRKDQIIDFQPPLADFFVSKVRCAQYAAAQNDFSDVLGEDKAETPKATPKKERKYQKSKLRLYETRDLKAAT